MMLTILSLVSPDIKITSLSNARIPIGKIVTQNKLIANANTDSVGETRIIVKFSNQYGGSVELTNSQVTGLTYAV